MKKILSFYISLSLIMGIISPYINLINSNNLYADSSVINEVCVNTDSQEYFPIVDERGNLILTKKEFNRECTLTKELQGACIKWETVKEDFIIEASDYNAYRSRNHEGSMGSLLAMIGAYDQLEHLWSGWKGYCEIGTKTNFDWASDPAFWAGLVASTIMDGSSAGEVVDGKVTGEGFLNGTELGTMVQDTQAGLNDYLSNSMLSSWAGKAAGQCMMAAGFDLGKNLLDYATSNSSDDMCDSVDEFCGDEDEQTEESDIITIDKVQYEDMIAQNEELADYIIILDEEDGILTVRYKNINEMDGFTEADMAQLEEMKEQMANMQLIISTAMTAAKLGACLVSEGNLGGTADSTASTDEDAPLLSVKNGIGMAVSSIPAEWLGPYGALIKAALQILVNFLYSFDNIDSCHNQNDADEQGERHSKTAEALPYDLCHFIYDKCVDNCGDAFLGLTKELIGYNYCCYDQILTKVIVTQLKAQLGRDWSHCTGISLRDLNFVSFRQCTAEEMLDGIDGGAEGVGNIGSDDGPISPEEGGYDPLTTFQYKNKCIDLTEFKEYLTSQIGDDIDLSDFDSIFSDVKTQNASQESSE